MTATLLVLASAALHAAWNATLKRHGDTRAAATLVLAIAALCACVPALLASAVAFPNREALAWTLASGVGEAAYFATLALALDASSLAVAYTITRGGSIVVVWPLSVAWLGERASRGALGGVLLILVGLVLTGIDGRPGARARARGIAWSVLCAVFIALVYVAYKRALAAGAEPSALFAVSLLVAFPISAASLGTRALARLGGVVRARPVTMIGAGVICAVSFLLFLGALHESGAGRVLTLRNTSVVFAHAFAWFTGEVPARVQLAGGALVVAGAVLLGLG